MLGASLVNRPLFNQLDNDLKLLDNQEITQKKVVELLFQHHVNPVIPQFKGIEQI